MTDIAKDKYDKEKAWGLLTSIDLKGCDPKLIRNAEHIKQYAEELCDLLGFKRFGECVVIHFGNRPQIEGYSMTQLIETSLISGHFANESNSAYLDIFSCKHYPAKKAVEFSSKFFKAKSSKFSCLLRK